MELYTHRDASNISIFPTRYHFPSLDHRAGHPSSVTINTMSTSAKVQPLSMSQTKDELLKALGMTPQTYTLMAVSSYQDAAVVWVIVV